MRILRSTISKSILIKLKWTGLSLLPSISLANWCTCIHGLALLTHLPLHPHPHLLYRTSTSKAPLKCCHLLQHPHPWIKMAVPCHVSYDSYLCLQLLLHCDVLSLLRARTFSCFIHLARSHWNQPDPPIDYIPAGSPPATLCSRQLPWATASLPTCFCPNPISTWCLFLALWSWPQPFLWFSEWGLSVVSSLS